MTGETNIFVPADALVPPAILKTISRDAQKLLEIVWNQASFEKRNRLYLCNKSIGKSAHIGMERLVAAQHELLGAGLVGIQFNEQPGLGLKRRGCVYIFDFRCRPVSKPTGDALERNSMA